jgi:hypothetical protein
MNERYMLDKKGLRKSFKSISESECHDLIYKNASKQDEGLSLIEFVKLFKKLVNLDSRGEKSTIVYDLLGGDDQQKINERKELIWWYFIVSRILHQNSGKRIKWTELKNDLGLTGITETDSTIKDEHDLDMEHVPIFIQKQRDNLFASIRPSVDSSE